MIDVHQTFPNRLFSQCDRQTASAGVCGLICSIQLLKFQTRQTWVHFVCLIKLSSADVQGRIMAEEESTIHIGLYVDIKYCVLAAWRGREGGEEEEEEEEKRLIYL